MNRRTFVITSAISAAAPLRWARAQSYPSKPVRLVVPFAPGGSVDFMARVINESLSRALGQPVIVDNKGGAGGAIGTLEVVRAPADGYTLLMVSPSITAANPAINPAAGYDPTTDLTPIINVAAGPLVLTVRPGYPAKTFAEFLAEVTKNPDKYTYATPGVGGIIHLQMELFKSVTGTSITHVPFRGAGPALTAVTSGQVDVMLDALPSALPFIKTDRLVPLVVTGPSRIRDLPNIPTFAEVGYANLNVMSPFGILGPKGLSKDIVDKINAAVRRAVEDPKVKQRIEDSGAVVVASTPQEFAKDIAELFAQLKKVVIERKLKVE